MNSTQTPTSLSRGLSPQRCPATYALMPNRVRNFSGYHVSFNPRSSDYGCPTTALVLQGRVFLVLNGDHVDDLIAAAERDGVGGCVALFADRIQDANPLSEHPMAVGCATDPFGLQLTALEVIGQPGVSAIIAAMSRQESSSSNLSPAT